ncbi:MAG: transposase [Syntrophobacteraceae bacterium]
MYYRGVVLLHEKQPERRNDQQQHDRADEHTAYDHGRKISHTEVSQANRELIDSVERRRNRDLSQEQIMYLFFDGVNFDMRIGGTIEKTPVLVAIGVTESGQRLVLGLQAGDKESESGWREFFKDFKRRGLSATKVSLEIMDGLPGLGRIFAKEFPGAKVQRCQVHVARNDLAKAPQKFKEAVADGMRPIFYASSREKAADAQLPVLMIAIDSKFLESLVAKITRRTDRTAFHADHRIILGFADKERMATSSNFSISW